MKEDKEKCVFCRIIAGEADVSMIYEDEICMAFMDIQPVNPGHLLIIPREHIPYLDGLDPEVGAHLFKISLRLNKALRLSGVSCEGVNYFLADGEAAMQEVFHTHLHLFPRYKNDGFGLRFGSHYWTKPSRSELNNICKRIKEHF